MCNFVPHAQAALHSKKNHHHVGDLYGQLGTYGLRICEITGDGNCLFRSIADQLDGHDGQHTELRAAAVAYMRANEDIFAPFVEDDEPFVNYCDRMLEVVFNDLVCVCVCREREGHMFLGSTFET